MGLWLERNNFMETLAGSLERIAKWLRADQEGRLAYQEDRLVELSMNMGTEEGEY